MTPPAARAAADTALPATATDPAQCVGDIRATVAAGIRSGRSRRPHPAALRALATSSRELATEPCGAGSAGSGLGRCESARHRRRRQCPPGSTRYPGTVVLGWRSAVSEPSAPPRAGQCLCVPPGSDHGSGQDVAHGGRGSTEMSPRGAAGRRTRRRRRCGRRGTMPPLKTITRPSARQFDVDLRPAVVGARVAGQVGGVKVGDQREVRPLPASVGLGGVLFGSAPACVGLPAGGPRAHQDRRQSPPLPRLRAVACETNSAGRLL
jgi:hypothetical protein